MHLKLFFFVTLVAVVAAARYHNKNGKSQENGDQRWKKEINRSKSSYPNEKYGDTLNDDPYTHKEVLASKSRKVKSVVPKSSEHLEQEVESSVNRMETTVFSQDMMNTLIPKGNLREKIFIEDGKAYAKGKDPLEGRQSSYAAKEDSFKARDSFYAAKEDPFTNEENSYTKRADAFTGRKSTNVASDDLISETGPTQLPLPYAPNEDVLAYEQMLRTIADLGKEAGSSDEVNLYNRIAEELLALYKAFKLNVEPSRATVSGYKAIGQDERRNEEVGSADDSEKFLANLCSKDCLEREFQREKETTANGYQRAKNTPKEYSDVAGPCLKYNVESCDERQKLVQTGSSSDVIKLQQKVSMLERKILDMEQIIYME